jgi:hypothetical protein
MQVNSASAFVRFAVAACLSGILFAGKLSVVNFCNCRKSGLCRRTTACVRRYSDASFYRYFDLVRLKHRLSDHCQNMLALDRSSNHGPEAHGTAPSQERLTRFHNAESMRVRKHPLHRTCRFQTSSRLRRMINCTIRSQNRKENGTYERIR